MSLDLDLSNVQEQSNNIPDGAYSVIINKAEVVSTKSGGEMIKVQMKINDGSAQNGRVIFDQFNLKNANPLAVQIGLSTLKTMMKAFGHPNPNVLKSTDELLGLKGVVTVKVSEDVGYGPQTRVRAYKPTTVTTASATNGAANPFS